MFRDHPMTGYQDGSPSGAAQRVQPERNPPATSPPLLPGGRGHGRGSVQVRHPFGPSVQDWRHHIKSPSSSNSLEEDWKTIVPDWTTMPERQRQQQNAIWELVQTEVDYLRTLKVITDVRSRAVFVGFTLRRIDYSMDSILFFFSCSWPACATSKLPRSSTRSTRSDSSPTSRRSTWRTEPFGRITSSPC